MLEEKIHQHKKRYIVYVKEPRGNVQLYDIQQKLKNFVKLTEKDVEYIKALADNEILDMVILFNECYSVLIDYVDAT